MSNRNDRASSRKRPAKSTIIPVLGLIILTCIAFGNSFSGAFLFDDGLAIVDNHLIRSISSPLRLLTALPPGPVVTFTLAVNYALGGLKPFGYHAFNLLIHLSAGLALFGIIRRTLSALWCRRGASGLAFASAAIWLVHPLQTESVTYIIQRYESLMALFYLLTLYCVIRGAGAKRPGGWYSGAIVICGLGMITKESMVTAPLMVIIYDRIFLSCSFRQLIRRRKILYAGLAITWLLLIMVVIKKPYAGWGGFGFTGISPWQYGCSQPGVVCHYLRLSFLPYPLCLDYGRPVAARMIDIITPAILIGVIAVITILGLLKRRPIGFAGAWFFLALAPTSSLIPISDLAFEHRMYLALAAVIVVPVVALYWLLLRLFPLHSQRRKIIIPVILVPVIITLVILTIQRNRDYYSPVLMWKDVVATRPENSRGHYNLGNALSGAGRINDAIDSYRIAISLRPGYVEAYYNLALNLEESDRIDEAIKNYRRALELDPESAKTHNNLARALIKTGDEEPAIDLLQSAIRLNPTISEPRINLANLEARRGDRHAAITRYLDITRDFPDSDEALYNLAVTLAVDGDYLSAEEYYRKSIRINPDRADAHYNLALLLWKRGDESGARDHLQKTLRIDPEFPEAGSVLARIEMCNDKSFVKE